MGCRQSRLLYVDDSVKVARRKDRQQYQQHVKKEEEVDRTIRSQKSSADDSVAAATDAGPLQHESSGQNGGE